MSGKSVEVAIVGGGPVGLTAAIALAGAGIATALIAKPAGAPDNRTTALLASSVTALDTLGVWQLCRDQAAPLRVMRIIDDTGRLLRAPEVHFAAAEIGLDAFGHNIENRFLLAALEARARALAALTFIEEAAQTVAIEDTRVVIALEHGDRVTAALAIGADGRRSLCRQAAGIATDRQAYRQTALTFNLRHQRPHQDSSTELHTATGPFTLVPLPGQRSSLVLVADPDEAARIGALAPDALAAEIRSSAAPSRSPAAAPFRWRSRPPGALRSRAWCWSAKPPICCRRSARRVSISACATPPRSASWWWRCAGTAATWALPTSPIAMTARDAPM
jgi:2-octaprenyl-6-methoxyphenol hydroxylase